MPTRPESGNRAALRGNHAEAGGNLSSGGWVTTRQAARALGVIPRQVRNYIAAGDLEGNKEGIGTNERWLISISSLEALRQKRQSEGKMPGKYHEDAAQGEEPRHTAEVNAELIRELAAKLEDAQYELGRAEARLELTSQTESTLRAERERLLEDLARERERADRLEAELRDIRKPSPDTQEIREPVSSEEPHSTHAPQSPDRHFERSESEKYTRYGTSPQEAEDSLHRRSERSWWRRFFGLE
jgi:chromosome segregation ATPase